MVRPLCKIGCTCVTETGGGSGDGEDSEIGIALLLRAKNDTCLSHSDQGWGKQLTRPCVGRQPSPGPGLRAAVRTVPLAGPGGGRPTGGRQRSVISWAASSHPTYELGILGSCSCTTHSFLPPGVCSPHPCPASGSAMRSGQVPSLSGIHNSRVWARRCRRSQPRCLEEKQKQKQKEDKLASCVCMPRFEPFSGCVKIISFVCSSVSLSVGKIQTSHRLALIITVCK